MQRAFREMTHREGTDPDQLESESRYWIADSRGDLTWDTVLASRRVLLVAAAGAGKTYECDRQAASMFARGEPAFCLRLENLPARGVAGSLRRKQLQRFKAWLASSSQLGYFFLDSVDELQLVHGSFREALERIAEELEGALGRAVIVVTSRPVPIDRQAFIDILPVPARPTKVERGEEFVSIAMRAGDANEEDKAAEPFKEYSLLPLGDRQIVELAREHRVASPDKLLQEIEARNARDFARWPQELIELCDDWRSHGQIRAHRRQVESHVNTRLKARVDRRERADLSLDRARQGAQRLAMAVMFCRRWTFRYSADADVPGSGDEPIEPTGLLKEWTAHEIAALLERPLFGDGGYGRVRFRHRSVLEYLAACQMEQQIASGTLSESAAKRMLFALTDTNEKVPKPSMRPIAGWLSLLRPAIFKAVLEVDPGTLLIHGDPESLEPSQCEAALRAFVEVHGKGQRRGLELPSVQVSRLARQPLGSVVRSVWHGIENPEIRQLLLQLVADGKYLDCADLAASIATDPTARSNERYEAMVALSRLSDDRLPGFIESAMSVSKGWPEMLGRWIGANLYPEHVTDKQLLTLLGKVTHESRRDTDFAGTVARVLEGSDVGTGRLRALLPGLMDLSRRLVKFDEDEVAEPAGRLKASAILRSVCIRLLTEGVVADDVLLASVMAIRAAAAFHEHRGSNAELLKLIGQLPVQLRMRVFDLDYAWITERYPERASKDVLLRLAFRDGPLVYSFKTDRHWVNHALGDVSRPVDCRAVLLHLAVHLAPIVEGKLSCAKAIRRAVADSAELTAQLEDALTAATRPNPAYAKMLKEQEKRKKKNQRENARQRKQWLEVWRRLAKTPAAALAPERRDNTIWNICLALRNKPKNQGETRWDRAFLQRHFGQPATDDLRQALMLYWRGRRPTIRRERKAGEKNTYLLVWTNALMGLYAEAEDSSWAAKLSSDEAELAARYALLELNGLPSWLVELAAAHPAVVERVIGEEIEEELSESAGAEGWTSMHLQAIRHGRHEITALLEPRLVAWLKSAQPLLRKRAHSQELESKLDQVIRTLLAGGSEQARRWLAELASRQISAAGHGPFLTFWLPVLCNTHPRRGLASLLAALAGLPIERDGLAVRVLGCLFEDRMHTGPTTWRTNLSPEDMLQLVKVVFHHVRPSDDIVHDGVYSPGCRDHAEDGRRIVFNELMATTGPGSMEAKLALARESALASSRDHIKMLAYERLANEIDASVFTPEDVADLLRGSELTPQTGTDMAHLLTDRLDDLRELMLRDTSPRSAWALVDDENALRPAIAREFEVAARGAYTVDQEAVTADGKETDIRMRAVSGHQATIELKIGEKQRSGRELRDTIEEQLVRKYMAHSKARTGCLMVTVKNPAKRWDHPDTGVRMDRVKLQEMLSQAALDAQQRLGGEARVLARVLDLTPRLPTEAQARPSRKSRKSRPPAA